MIYSEDLSFCFIAVPKTGTTSIETCLRYYCDCNNIQYIKSSNRGSVSDKHIKLKDLEKIYNLKQTYKIGFVRNPWDKVASWYHYLKGNKTSPHSIPEDITFESFLQNAPKFVFAQSSDFLIKSDGTIGVDFIGRFETLVEDFSKICSKVNIFDVKLMQLNSSENKSCHYSKLYKTQKTVSFVEQKFQDDIKLFNYTFEYIL